MTTRLVRLSWGLEGRACAALVLSLSCLVACDNADGGAALTDNEAKAADDNVTGERPVHLEARSGTGAGPFSRASFQKKPGEAAELEIAVEHAPSGVTHVVTLGGRELGKLLIDLEGEGELEFGPQGLSFPADFVAPVAGDTLRIGTLMELPLSPLERLLHLETEFTAGKVKGKASFKVELLAGQRTREFKLRVSGAPGDTTHPVSLDGVGVGTLEVGADGKGKLEYSEVERIPFPAGFPEIKAGAKLELGQLFAGRLDLAAKGEAR